MTPEKVQLPLTPALLLELSFFLQELVNNTPKVQKLNNTLFIVLFCFKLLDYLLYLLQTYPSNDLIATILYLLSEFIKLHNCTVYLVDYLVRLSDISPL